MAYLQKEEEERRSAHAMPIARAVLVSVGCKDPKALLAYIDPWGDALATSWAKETISPKSAKVFLELISEKRIPSWVIRSVDIELIKRAGSDG